MNTVSGIITGITQVKGPITVKALHKTMRGEVILNEGLTALEGKYEIKYESSVSLNESAGTNIFIRVFDVLGEVLAESQVYFNVTGDLVIDLSLADKISVKTEFEVIKRKVTPLMGNIKFSQINIRDTQDSAFIATSAKVNESSVKLLSKSYKLAEQTGIRAEILYGLQRRNISVEADKVALHPSTIIKSLEWAEKDNLIPVISQEEKIAVAEKLVSMGESAILQREIPGTALPIGKLISLAVPDEEAAKSISIAYMKGSYPLDRVFLKKVVAANPSLMPYAQNARLLFKLNRVLGNHLPLVEYLYVNKNTLKLKSERCLARFGTKDWENILDGRSVNGLKIDLPQDLEGQQRVQTLKNYALSLVQAIEKEYPTDFMAYRLVNSVKSPSLGRFFARYLSNKSGFSIFTTDIDSYFKARKNAKFVERLGEVEARTLKKELKSLQRVYKLIQDYDKTQVLLDDGLSSAYDVTRIPKDEYLGKYSGLFGSQDEAGNVYENAQRVVDLASNLVAAEMSERSIAVRSISSKPQIPQLENLFGGFDLSICEDWRTVLSPAAYLTDILHFMQNRVLKGKSIYLNAGGELFARRPDLAHILLNEENSFTPISYIDLVNEVLEDIMVPPLFCLMLDANKGRTIINSLEKGQMDALLVKEMERYSEFLSDDVTVEKSTKLNTFISKDRKSGTVFVLWNASAQSPSATDYRIWVSKYYQTTVVSKKSASEPDHSNPQAYEALRNLVFPFELPFDLYLEEIRLCLEKMNIKRSELIESFLRQDSKSGRKALACEYLGMTSAEWDILSCTGIYSLSEVLGCRNPKTQDIIKEFKLNNVRVLLKKIGLKYEELEKILKTYYVNRQGLLFIQAEKPEYEPTSDTSKLVIENLDNSSVFHIYKLLRLTKRTGWNYQMMDRVITGLVGSNGEVDEDTLINIAYLHRLSQKLRTDVPTVLSWYTTIDTGMFANALDSEDVFLYSKVFERTEVTELRPSGLNKFKLTSLKDQLQMYQECLVKQIALPTLTDPENKPSLLAALGITETELSLLINGMSTGNTMVIKPYLPDANLNLENLCRLFKIVTLSRSLKFQLNQLLTIINLTGIDPFHISGNFLPGSTLEFIDAVNLIKTSGLSLEFLEYLLRNITYTEFKEELAIEKATVILEELRFGLSKLHLEAEDDNQRVLASTAFIIDKLAGVLQADADIIKDLVCLYLNSPIDQSKIVLSAFINDEFVLSPNDKLVSITDFEAQYKALLLVYKAVLLISKYKLNRDVIRVISECATKYPASVVDFNVLPVEEAAGTKQRYKAWEGLERIRRLIAMLPGGEDAVKLTLNYATTGESGGFQTYLTELSRATGWALDSLTTIAGSGSLNANLFDCYADGTFLIAVDRCIALSENIGVSSTYCLDWCKESKHIKAEDAKSAKRALKARYGEEAWLDTIGSISDSLREKKRNAMVAYHLAFPRMITIGNTETPMWEDENGLYQHYLIDVEMSYKMVTTRMKQAISSVQLFVQRCLMNLEQPALRVDLKVDSGWSQWKWMKNYRVWEANRKVFLYPENWIEADLRLDKSPFFKELENELMQGEVTDEAAESALLNYLEKLDAVARLEVTSFFEDLESAEMHVLARTKNAPHIYYYRKQVNSSWWTPWERVGLDIEGDYVKIISWVGKLYIVWLMINEKAVVDDFEYKTQGLHPFKTLEAKVAYSEYRNGKWQPKKMNPQAVELNPSQCLSRYRDSCKKCDHCQTLRSYCAQNIEKLKKGILFNITVQDDMQILIEYAKTFYDAKKYSFLSYDSMKRKSIRNEFDGIRFINGYENDSDYTFWNYDFPWTSYENNKVVFVGDAEFYPFNTVALCVPSKDYSTSKEAMLSLNNSTENKGGYNIIENPNNRRKFFMEDNRRTFFITVEDSKFVFRPFYHPFTWLFSSSLASKGIEGLMDRRLQLEPCKINTKRGKEFCFFREYGPDYHYVSPNHPKEEIDFGFEGAYSIYNWEIFFHIPMLIAGKLAINNRFDEAKKWYNYIFDPTDISEDINPPERYWKTGPFAKPADKDLMGKPIQELLVLIARKSAGEAINNDEKRMVGVITEQIRRWRSEAFNPHVIARLRLSAYQKSIVMKYLDNLIAWGDNLFRQDTMEAINEATQIYVLAALILGDRPELIPSRFKTTSKTYDYLSNKMSKDDFSDPLVEAENLITIPNGAGNVNSSNGNAVIIPNVPKLPMLYFGVPHNEKLMHYWDIVGDRLYKIRHCMNIEGLERVLSLFEPPIDPGLLVKAAAAGIDIGSVLSDASAPMPYFRFRVMVQKTLELCSEVKVLGSTMLAALEKRDAEKLSLLKSTHEIEMFSVMCLIKEKNIDEAKQQLEALTLSKALVSLKQDYYSNIPFINENESKNLTQLKKANQYQLNASECQKVAQYMAMIPDFILGASGIASPVVEFKFGGTLLSQMCQAESTSISMSATHETYGANKSSIMGSFNRRWDDWQLNKRLADKEVEQLDKQIAAAEIRVALAERELENLKVQIENSQEEEALIKDKFTNLELYDWMTAQVAAVYFQAYKMAFDMAKKAEKAFQYELASSSGFLQYGYWDSLKKGLLSGEKLQNDVKRMELAYLDQNKRDYEITKHVSLALLDPESLLKLKTNGECFVNLPEWLFDQDYPGHYMRRIKNVSISIPCITGPYTGINCRLTLNSSSIRLKSTLSSEYRKDESGEDDRFYENPCSIQSIVTSSAQNDSGLFETSLQDERYLPFEGAGVISNWRLVLDPDCNGFDLQTISDVVMHLRYTAKEGGDNYKQVVKTETLGLLAEVINVPVLRLLSIKNLFSSEWFKLTTAGNSQAPSLKLELTADKFPYLLRNKTLKVSKAEVLFIPSDLTGNNKLGTFSVSRLGFDGLQVIESPATVPHPKIANVFMTELTSLKDLEISKGSSFELSLKFASTELVQAVSAVADIGILLHCTVKMGESPE